MLDEKQPGDAQPLDTALVYDPSDTLIVPPPNFHERLLAAQRARTLEARLSTDFPLPSTTLAEKPTVPLSTTPDNPIQPQVLP